MVRNREEAARNAEQSTSNVPGTCQLWTRNRFLAPSAGDRDGDGDADAVDGWKSEPVSARHEGDKNPPRGVPVAWSGGSRGFGHRAVSLGNGKVRSTDMSDTGGRYQKGNVGTATIDQISNAMGIQYLGWTETITGQRIPLAPKPKPSPKPTPAPKPTRVSEARDLLEKAMIRANRKKRPVRAKALQTALKVLPKR
jgi:hypothetical protein